MFEVDPVEEDIIIDRNMKLIDLNTLEYPLYIRDLVSRIGTISFGTYVEASFLEPFGYGPVVKTPSEPNDVVRELPPVKRGKYYHEVWESRPFNEEELAVILSQDKDWAISYIDSWRDSCFDKGIPYQFGNNVYHIQARSVDCGNIHGLYTRAKELLEAGTDKEFKFRVYENVTVTLNALEIIAMANTFLDKLSEGYELSWNLKDLTNAATHKDQFPVVPEELFTLN